MANHTMSKHMSRVPFYQNTQYVNLSTCTFKAMSKCTSNHQKGCFRTFVKAESKLCQRQCQSVCQRQSDFIIVYQSACEVLNDVNVYVGLMSYQILCERM